MMQTLENLLWCHFDSFSSVQEALPRGLQSGRQKPPSYTKTNEREKLGRGEGARNYGCKKGTHRCCAMRLKGLVRLVRLVALTEPRHDQCVAITRFCPVDRLFVNKQLSLLKVLLFS